MEKEDNTLNIASIVVQVLMNILFYGIAIYLTVNFSNRKDEVIMMYPEHLNYNRFSFRNQEKEGRLCKVA